MALLWPPSLADGMQYGFNPFQRAVRENSGQRCVTKVPEAKRIV